ncbi:TVP38/TMEM64 family protein [Roseivivax sp. CAU 1761]
MTDATPRTPPKAAEEPGRGRLVRHLPLALILIGAVVGFFTLGDFLSFETLRTHRAALLAFRDSHFVALLAAYAAIYVAMVAFSLPGATVATVTGGFLFGLWTGAGVAVVAATLGAVLIFLAARAGLGRALAARIDASDGAARRLRDRLHDNEIPVLFLMRLIPVVPFFVANLVPALVGVRFRNFLLTTALGIVPGTLVFTSIGVGLGEVFDRGGTPDLDLLWTPQVIGPILGLIALAALPLILKAWRGRRGL